MLSAKKIYLQPMIGFAAVLFAMMTWSPQAVALTLQGKEASDYTRYCAVDNRAVWIETFEQGNLAGYISLVCLHEPTQTTNRWWITPEDKVIAEGALPDFPEPAPTVLHSGIAELLYSPDHPINVDPLARQPLTLSFRVDLPILPDLGFSWGSTGSSYTGDDGIVISEAQYWVEGEEVDQVTFEAYFAAVQAAELAQEMERDRLIRQSAQTMLYELTDINNWHEWLDVDAINTRSSTDACWIYQETILISLNRVEIDRLVESSVSLVSAEVYGIPVDTVDGVTSDDAGQTEVPEWSVQSECARINSAEDRYVGGSIDQSSVSSSSDGVLEDGIGKSSVISDDKSQSGAVGVWFLFILASTFARVPKRDS